MLRYHPATRSRGGPRGISPRAQGWAACDGPRVLLATGISSVPGGKSPFARGIPTWPLHSIFKDSKEPYQVSASAPDASHSSNARKCAEPCSISSKRAPRLPPQGLAASRHSPQAKGKGTAPLPRMSLQRRQQVTQPCPSPVSAGPRMAAGALRAGRLDCTQPKVRQTEGRGEMVSDPAAPRSLWPPLGFTLNRSQSEGCCWDRCHTRSNGLAAGYASWGVLYSQKSK